MYLVKLYDAEAGDLTDVTPAETFDDGVAHILGAVGASFVYEVEATWLNGVGSLKVVLSEVTLASLEWVPPLERNQDAVVTEACNGLQGGDVSALVNLFVERALASATP